MNNKLFAIALVYIRVRIGDKQLKNTKTELYLCKKVAENENNAFNGAVKQLNAGFINSKYNIILTHNAVTEITQAHLDVSTLMNI